MQIIYDVHFLSSNGDNLHDCVSYMKLAVNILFPVYSLFSLFFVVKYMNVVINVNQNVARISLMHAIGTSLALWVFTIIHEIVDAVAESDAENSGKIPTNSIQSRVLLNFLSKRKCIFQFDSNVSCHPTKWNIWFCV